MKKLILFVAGCMAIIPACGKPAAANSHNSADSATEAATESDKGVRDTQDPTTLDLYNLKTPVKVMKEWAISHSDLAENPKLNPTSPDAVKAAIEKEILDEMSVRVVDYEFGSDSKANDWVLTYSGNTPTEVRMNGIPGTFNVKYENGLPTQFTLNQQAFQKAVDEGNMFLDAYDVGFDKFTITYDKDGMPASLSGEPMSVFGGAKYTETYSDYKFDDKGNWVRRKVTTPYDTKNQYRFYVY